MIVKKISFGILTIAILIMGLIRFNVIKATPESPIFILACGMATGSLLFLINHLKLKKLQ